MKNNPVSVLILYNQPPESCGDRPAAFYESQAGVLEEVKAVSAAFEGLKIGYHTAGVKTFSEVPAVLSKAGENVIFNLVEGFEDYPLYANYVPSLCRAFSKGFTGNDTPGLLLSLDKWHTKSVLLGAGLACPAAVIVPLGEKIRQALLPEPPYIVKPLQTDASEGIDNSSIVRCRTVKLTKAVERVHREFRQPALIEQFIEGRELNVSVIWDKGGPTVLPLAEIDFSAFDCGRPRIVGYQAKWLADSFEFNNTPRLIPAPVDKRLAEKIRYLAVAACRALGCEDYARVDFRLDGRNRPYILEVNANPDISPDAGFCAALKAARISYRRFVGLVIKNALRRQKTAESKKRSGRKNITAKNGKAGPVESGIRFSIPQDVPAVIDILRHTAFFRPDEIEVAAEVITEAANDGPAGHYQSYTMEVNGQIAGWVCFGPTPCTLGTYDVYWIAVDPRQQSKGFGRQLMDFAEKAIAAAGGRMTIVETSGRAIYEPTRRFYERLGYSKACCIAEFYAPGDDKVIYIKAAGSSKQ